ncbi:hypothetical protein [Plantactinospora sp. CA-290183]|uniref:hypothetical protein n=1 Tax=Plantactinospora sp. CA-290183 TaxID=3240006 RepID=UPI003D911004
MSESTTSPPPGASERLLTGLAEHGPMTAAVLAGHIGIGYSTATSRLRELEGLGHVEKTRTGKSTVTWQLTDQGAEAATSTGERHSSPTETPAIVGQPSETGGAPVTGLTSSGTPQPDPDDAAQADAPDNDDNAASGDAAPGPEVGTTRNLNGSTVQAKDLGIAAGGDGAQGSSANTRPARARRRKGELRAAVLALLKAKPGKPYKVQEICHLLNAGTTASKFSNGAVANALNKLTEDGSVQRLEDNIATYQAP